MVVVEWLRAWNVGRAARGREKEVGRERDAAAKKSCAFLPLWDDAPLVFQLSSSYLVLPGVGVG